MATEIEKVSHKLKKMSIISNLLKYIFSESFLFCVVSIKIIGFVRVPMYEAVPEAVPVTARAVTSVNYTPPKKVLVS